MMTFYLGDEVKVYKKKFKELKRHFMKDVEKGSNAEIFRHIIDILHKELIKREKDKEETKS